MRPSPLFVLTPFALVALSACEEGSVCTRAAEVEDAGLEIGVGAERFERAIDDGAVLEPAFGGQGGQHLWLAVRTRGFAPGARTPFGDDRDVPVFTAELLDAETGELLTIQRFDFEAMEGDEVVAELALGEFRLPFDEYYGSTPTGAPEDPTYLLRVTAEDACGTTFVDEHEVRID